MDYTKQLESKYSVSIIRYLRKRGGLEKDDRSMDKEFLNMSKGEVFKDVLSWNGLLGGWDYTIKDWIREIYKIDLDELEEN
jgi:hypothetical protein